MLFVTAIAVAAVAGLYLYKNEDARANVVAVLKTKAEAVTAFVKRKG